MCPVNLTTKFFDKAIENNPKLEPRVFLLQVLVMSNADEMTCKRVRGRKGQHWVLAQAAQS